MKLFKSLTGAVVALAVGLGTMVAPQAEAQVVATGDHSQQCSVDWNADYPGNGVHVLNPLKIGNPLATTDDEIGGSLSESAGFLAVHGWDNNNRIIAGTVFPIENAQLTVTFENGLPEGVVFSEGNFWENQPDNIFYQQYRKKYPNDIYLPEARQISDTTVVFDLGDLPALSSVHVQASNVGQNPGPISARLVGDWDSLEFQSTINTLKRDPLYTGVQNIERFVPDCYRPTTVVQDGDNSDRCNVNWNAGVILDRRFQDWSNNGYTRKIAPGIFETHQGNMEIQHYTAGNDLYLRIPVVVDTEVKGAELTVDLPEVGNGWEFNSYHDRTFGVITEADYTKIGTLAPPVIEGNTATLTIGDMPAKSYFTVIFRAPGVNDAVLDAATEPFANGEWSDAVQANATLTGEYALGSDCQSLYDDSYTTPGTLVTVNINHEAAPPAGTTYEVTGVPTGWDAVVDPNTGRLMITPPEGTEQGVYVITVTGTTPTGQKFDVMARVHVDTDCNCVKEFKIVNGDLIVYYEDGTETNLGPVVGDTIKIEQIVNEDGDVIGNTVIIIGADGEEKDRFDVLNGQDGADGADGADGTDGTIVNIEEVAPSDEYPYGGVKIITIQPDGTTESMVVENGAPGGSSIDAGSSEGSSDGVSDRCISAGLTVGIPLLLLIPFGLATQMNIPGLSPIVGQINSALEDMNAQLQQQLGVFDANQAGFVQQLNAQLGIAGKDLGAIAGGLGLVAAGLLTAKYLADNCLPGAADNEAGSSLSSIRPV